MTIKLIFCQSQNGNIGKDNDILFRLPPDMKYFKEMTTNHLVLMGRKTWESIPAKFRPLPNRTNFIASKTMDLPEGADVSIGIIQNLEMFLEAYSKASAVDTWVIGGEQIYNAALPFADEVHQTIVFQDKEGDTKAPTLVPEDWTVVSQTPGQFEDLQFTINVYKRNYHDNRNQEGSS